MIVEEMKPCKGGGLEEAEKRKNNESTMRATANSILAGKNQASNHVMLLLVRSHVKYLYPFYARKK